MGADCAVSGCRRPGISYRTLPRTWISSLLVAVTIGRWRRRVARRRLQLLPVPTAARRPHPPLLRAYRHRRRLAITIITDRRPCPRSSSTARKAKPWSASRVTNVGLGRPTRSANRCHRLRRRKPRRHLPLRLPRRPK